MNICFFADAGNIHLQRIASSLAWRGHVVHVVSHKPVDIPDVSVERFAVPSPGLTRPYRWNGRLIRYLRNFTDRFDVVVLMFLNDWGFTTEIMTDGCFVTFPQGSDIVPPPGENPPALELTSKRREWLRAADLVGVTCRRFARIVGVFASLDESSIGSLPIGVDMKKFQPQPSATAGRSAGFRVGYLKGFREVYGPTVLVESIPHVLKHVANVTFEMVGDGPCLSRCKEMAARLGIEAAIRWLPRQAHDAVPGILSCWDVSVIPSHFESFGVAALESSAMSVPVIASNVGGLPDAVNDGRTGLLVEPGSPGDLGSAIVEILGNSKRRRQMGEAGRDWVRQHYGWASCIEQWERTLQHAVERSTAMV